MSGSNVTAVSVPATVHRVATASKRAGDRSYLALLLALSALVMGTLAVLHDHYVLLAGDEPNYLIISGKATPTTPNTGARSRVNLRVGLNAYQELATSSPAGTSCWTEQSSPAADPRTKGAP